jgi:hypothetical protein
LKPYRGRGRPDSDFWSDSERQGGAAGRRLLGFTSGIRKGEDQPRHHHKKEKNLPEPNEAPGAILSGKLVPEFPEPTGSEGGPGKSEHGAEGQDLRRGIGAAPEAPGRPGREVGGVGIRVRLGGLCDEARGKGEMGLSSGEVLWERPLSGARRYRISETPSTQSSPSASERLSRRVYRSRSSAGRDSLVTPSVVLRSADSTLLSDALGVTCARCRRVSGARPR